MLKQGYIAEADLDLITVADEAADIVKAALRSPAAEG